MLYTDIMELLRSCTSIYGRKECGRFDIEKALFPSTEEGYSFKYKGAKEDIEVRLPVSQAIRLTKDSLPSNWKKALGDPNNYPKLWQNIESYIYLKKENIRQIDYEALSAGLEKEAIAFIDKHLKRVNFDTKNFCILGIFICIQMIANIKVAESPSKELTKLITEKISVHDEETAPKHNSELGNSSGNVPFESDTRLSSNIILPDVNFVGRQSEFDVLQQKLLSSPTIFPKIIYGRDTLIDNVAKRLKEKHIVFLYGIGGIGKTQIAKNYAEKYGSEYDTVIYGTCNISKEDLKESVLKDLLLSEDVFAFEPKMNRRVLSDGSLENDDDYAKRKLQKIKELSNERTLIIVDNFDVMEDKLLSEFINGRYHLLITTRCSYENRHPTIKIKEIEDIRDLKEIFFKNYRCDVVSREDAYLEELIELVNRHTYTIELLAKHMSNSGQPTSEMINLLKGEGIVCLDEEIRNDDCSTDIASENLVKMFKIFGLSDEEKQILQYMCLMPLNGVKKSDFKRWAGLRSLSRVTNLIDRSWIIDNNNDIALHPIILDVVQIQLPLTNDNIEFFIINFINDMNDVHNTLRKHHLTYRERKIHLDIAEILIEKITFEKLLYDQLRFIYAYCVFDTGNSNRAVQLFEELLLANNDLAFKLNCYEKVIQNYVLLGDASGALKIALKAYKEVEPFAFNIIPPDIGRHYICLLHRFIETYRLLGDYEKSLYYGTLCLSQGDKFFEIYKGDLTAWTKYHIGRTLVLKGKPCEEILKEAMDVFLSNQDELAIANCRDVWALVYKQKGLFVEALTINEQAYETHVHLLGKYHVDIANNRRWRGDIYKACNDDTNAKKCYIHAITIYREIGCPILEAETIKELSFLNASSEM